MELLTSFATRRDILLKLCIYTMYLPYVQDKYVEHQFRFIEQFVFNLTVLLET